MTTQWMPYREPLRTTILRNGVIAIVVGAVLAPLWGGLARWLLATLLVLWPSLGGHLWSYGSSTGCALASSIARGLQVAARVGVWFVGGTGLAIGMALTAMVLAGFRPARWPAWWIGGIAFIGVELVAHLALRLRGRPSFYNGRG